MKKFNINGLFVFDKWNLARLHMKSETWHEWLRLNNNAMLIVLLRTAIIRHKHTFLWWDKDITMYLYRGPLYIIEELKQGHIQSASYMCYALRVTKI